MQRFTRPAAILICLSLLASAISASAAELMVVGLSPVPHAMAAANTAISITFDRAVKRSSVDASSVRVFGRTTGTASRSVAYSAGDIVVTLTPSASFAAGETVTVNLSNALEAADGSPMRTAGYAFQFLVSVEPSLRSFDIVDVMSNRTTPGTQTRIYGAAAADFNNDEFADLATVNEVSADIRVFLNRANGTGTFDPFLTPEPIGVEASPNETADFDNDGNVDLCVSATASQSAWILLGNGDGTFTAAGPAQSSGGLSWVVVVGDVDGDGDLDAVAANSFSGNGAILRNNGDGALAAPELVNVGPHTPSADLGDMDGDGDLDLVLSSYGGGFWRMYTNDGSGTFTFDQEFSAPANPSCSILYDADDDGDLDMALTDEIADVVVLMENESASPCSPAPAVCRMPIAAGKSRLQIKDNGGADKDVVSWKWGKGAATTKAEFGDPTASDSFTLCIYAGGSLIYSADVPSGMAWSSSTKGYKYKEKNGFPDGVRSAAFKEGLVAGKATAKVKGRGVAVAPPDLGAISGSLDVQFQRNDAVICFGATFTPPFAKHDLVQLKARSD